jgi:hypothetical protein
MKQLSTNREIEALCPNCGGYVLYLDLKTNEFDCPGCGGHFTWLELMDDSDAVLPGQPLYTWREELAESAGLAVADDPDTTPYTLVWIKTWLAGHIMPGRGTWYVKSETRHTDGSATCELANYGILPCATITVLFQTAPGVYRADDELPF